MKNSPTMGKLFAALAKFQAEVPPIPKSKQGYGYKYCDLPTMIDICSPVLAKHELCVTQHNTRRNGNIAVRTLLGHSSGEFTSEIADIESFAIKGMNMAQSTGTIISYLRRYGYASVLCIAPDEDTDAALRVAPEEEAKQEAKPGKIQDSLKAKLAPSNALPLQRIYDLIKKHELDDKIVGWCEHYNVATLDDLTPDQALKLIKTVEVKYNGN